MTQFRKTASTFIKGAKTLPGKYYTCAAIFLEEIDRIFYSRWLCIGRVEQIPNPGDYFIQQVGQESIIVVRDRNGEVRSFYNICRHRGTRLCTEAQGNFNGKILCPYHAWAYGLDGQLEVAPLMNELDDFNQQDYPLHRVSVATWSGFLFLNLAESPEPFATAFGPILDKFAQWQLPRLRVSDRIIYDIQANWKLICQNYCECYHCPSLHPVLAKMSPYRSGENDLISGLFLGGFMKINQIGGSMTLSGNWCSLPLGNVSGEDLQRVYYYSIFPNMLLSLHPDYVMVHRLWPQSPNRTQIICEWLFDPDAMKQPSFNSRDAVEFWDITNRQDWQVCELMQTGVSSRAYTPSPYSSAESLLAEFDREYLKAIEH
ncbi:aromatic ring-hydroxylating oxygenase subunit alpha [Argonema galeatum]|uniref:aromatic ring-hydroxylating oxygenase subunit alpha n=1 Tax=Argonema galeatum TaxID=2942762 RepID=UPI002011C03C|nr:aromatic ring-hydroxylating dioxygenase subunit alpha [Argonema galeatum]MCL1463199.1 aromatic ring-hydroxylating dioxygenase subunit alpha [Argonema galeatum A003/A1]